MGYKYPSSTEFNRAQILPLAKPLAKPIVNAFKGGKGFEGTLPRRHGAKVMRVSMSPL